MRLRKRATPSAEGVAERRTKKRKNLSDDERKAVISELLKGSTNGVLKRGAYYSRVAELYGTNPRTIAVLWREYEHQKAAGAVCPDLSNKRRGKCGRKGIDLDSVRARLKGIPVGDRTSQRRLAAALGESHTALFTTISRRSACVLCRATSSRSRPEAKNEKERGGGPGVLKTDLLAAADGDRVYERSGSTLDR